MMVDKEVAYVSESSVYRILRESDLLYRWKRPQSSGTAPPEPTGPNQRWNTDLMYLRVEDSWYFLVTVLDGYSRYVVHWDLLGTMTAAAVRVVIEDAVRRTGARPQLVTDNGSQFRARDFKELVREFALEHIRIRTYHPESNGKVERFHRSTREALRAAALGNLGRARGIIDRWVAFYNGRRLHASRSTTCSPPSTGVAIPNDGSASAERSWHGPGGTGKRSITHGFRPPEQGPRCHFQPQPICPESAEALHPGVPRRYIGAGLQRCHMADNR